MSVAVRRDVIDAEQALAAGEPAESAFFIESYQLGHPAIAPL